ncbi:protein kinase [Actinoplanes bogorensis]|uniref:Protein kinase n=1 Tax=Paractinoplanes bogorensis TaxID=1610840 RepID=A0ABS5YSH7_9ACTN|nr:protein kinase [Actinoplanes bogorensis]MBU2666414.1 protein kinase [Actinoplanes bogorensis]
MLEDPEPIGEPDEPADDWVWPRAADGRSRLRRLGPNGRYTLRGFFGDGGQAYIWYAPDAVDGFPKAIKTSRPDGTLGSGQVAARRLVREARIMQSIPPHPNVMPLLDCGPDHLVRPESEGLRPRPDDPYEARDPWLVLPLTPHHRLGDLIAAGPLTAEAWLKLARGYAAGLAHLHRSEVVHRDLSPGNVLLTADGPVITDFGVSWAPRWFDREVEQTMSTGLTRQAAGRTEDWHAPEVIDAPLSRRPDRQPAYDVFSWGLFVATAAAGRHPWSKTPGHLVLERFERDRMSRAETPYDLDRHLAHAGWADLVLAALEPDPADRPTAADLVEALDREPARRRRATSRTETPQDRPVVVLREALLERWRSDPVWLRVGGESRLPIGWADGDPDEPDAVARLLRVWAPDGPTARMLVLGAAGSGKSELLVGVFRRLLTDWREGQPLPLLVPLASWDPALSDLRTWLIDWLHVNHQFLDRPAGGPVPRTQAERLLDGRQLALILDGLDEVLDKDRPDRVVAQLNNLDGPAQVLVSCRAGRPATGELFRGGVTLTLDAQDPAEAVGHLRRNGPADGRWDPVVASLPGRLDLAEVLRTPLMVMLADALYNDENRPPPSELLDRHGPEALTQHLLRGFVPARYAEETAEYSAPDARRWLGYLARMTAGPGELRWWDLRVTSAPASPVWLHVGTLAAVIGWTALSAGVMNTGVFGSAETGLTDAIRITLAALLGYAAIFRVTGSYPAAVLAVLGAYITGVLSGSYDLAVATGLVAGFSWRPLQPRAPARGGDLLTAVGVGVAAVAGVIAVRVLSLFVPLDDALVMGFAAGTFDGFTVRWDEDVNGWLATGLVAGLLTWAGIRVTRGGGPARPLLCGLVAGVVVCAIDVWADGARPGIDRPWLLAPGDGLAAGLAVWWIVWVTRGRRPVHPRMVRLGAPLLFGGLTAALNLLGYLDRADVTAGPVRALGEGAAVAVLLGLALRPSPGAGHRRRKVVPVVVAVLVGAAVGALHAVSAGPAKGAAAGLSMALTVLFFLLRDEVRSGPARIDPVEAGVLGLTVAGLLTGFAYALLFALVAGLGSRVSADVSQRRLPSLRISAPAAQIVGGALLGTMAAFAAGANGFPMVWLVVIGVTGGVAGAYAFGIRGDDPRNRLAASPTRLFRQDRRVFVRMTAVIAVALGTAVGARTAAGGQPAGTALAVAAGTLATYGLTAGLTVAASATRYGVFAVRSAYLAASDQLPWRLMRFLDDAHGRRQVLRAAGSAYQFRHELLREQIADAGPHDTGARTPVAGAPPR